MINQKVSITGGFGMSSEHKKLYRSRRDRMISGVCGGLGDFFGIDSTLIRVIFALLAIFGGSGLVIYLVMLLIVPEEPLAEITQTPDSKETRSDEMPDKVEE
jgi:phage shock protein PspC (stress-responsive transcriptional regulator)